MISTSNAWKTYVQTSSVFDIKATMTGGSTVNLTNEDFMQGSVSFTDSMSGMNEIKLGAVVTNSFSATLNNFDGRFDNWTWTEIEVWFGVNGEWIHRGKFIIDRPSSIGATIKIECFDYMDKLNRYFNGLITTTYPITYKALVQAICTACGVTFGTWSSAIPNTNVTALVADAFDESTTCRQVVGWLLETVGGYARINPVTNQLDCLVWNMAHWSTSDSIEGGIFDVWNSVSSYSGGTMNPWSVVTDRNGGTFFNGDGAYALEKVKNQTLFIDDIEVTGIDAYIYNNTTDTAVYGSAGTTGYVLNIKDNPFVNGDNKDTIASAVWANVQGLKVRPFDSSMFGDPSIEAGDTIVLHDLHTDTYHISLITSLTFTLGGDMRVSCDAKSPDEQALEMADSRNSIVKSATIYVNQEIDDLRDELENQIDGLIETWAQNTNPATAWTTAELRSLHNGDLWYYTGTSNLTVDGVTIEPSKTYQYNSSTQKWVAYNNPSTSLFDLADGKAKIFYGTTSGTYTGVEDGDYLVDSTNGTTYKRDSGAWVQQIASPVVNLLPTTYYTERRYGTEVASSSGITWVLNPDGSVTAKSTSGTYPVTLSASATYTICGNSLTDPYVSVITVDPTQRYIFSGSPSGGSSTKYRVRLRCTPDGTTPSSSSGSLVNDNGSGVLIPANTKYIYPYISIASGYSLTAELKFYPMLEVGTVKHKFVSNHAGSTKEITDKVNALDTSLNQTSVFNRLTNNGALQGLYMSGGDMYVNATYIHGGTLDLGGINNQDGLMRVYNASGTKVGQWDNTGIDAIAGTIGGWTLSSGNLTTTSGVYSNELSASTIRTSQDVTTPTTGTLYTELGSGELGFYHTGTTLLRIAPAYDTTKGAHTGFGTYRGLYLLPGAGGSVAFRYGGNEGNGTYGAPFYFGMYVKMAGGLTVSGTKSRVVDTKGYSERLLYCYETPSPMFGDVGEGVIGDDGKCYVWIDSIFAETIATDQYQVFLQKYGNGDCWVAERKGNCFIVEGTPNLKFGWEIKAKQKDFTQLRLEKDIDVDLPHNTFGEEAQKHLEELRKRRLEK